MYLRIFYTQTDLGSPQDEFLGKCLAVKDCSARIDSKNTLVLFRSIDPYRKTKHSFDLIHYFQNIFIII